MRDLGTSRKLRPLEPLGCRNIRPRSDGRRRHVGSIVEDEMPSPIPERLDVAQTDVLKLDPGLFASNSFRGVLRVLLVHEEIVREEPSSLAIVSSHVAILHKEDLAPGEEGDIRNEFVNRASAFHISNPDLEWASRPGSRKLPRVRMSDVSGSVPAGTIRS